jgi:hypothetical protein
MARVRKFQIDVIRNRKVTERVSAYEELPSGGRGLVTKELERVIPEGYMVYFPAGHSIFVDSKEQLTRLGLLESNNQEIDEEMGLPVPSQPTNDIKDRVLKRTHNAGVI